MRAARWCDRAVEAGALFLLVFTPLAFGTVQPWSEALAELVVLAMVVAWVARMAAEWELRVELPPGWLPATLFLGLVLLQLVPLPPEVRGVVAPLSARVTGEAAAFAGAADGPAPLSLFPHATWREGAKLFAAAAFLLVLYNTCRTRAQADRAIWTMIAVGSLVALFGIVQRVTWTGHFYWIGPEAPRPSAFGPFVNRAHFAGLIAVVVPVALAVAVAAAEGSRRPRERRGLGRRLRDWAAAEGEPVGLVPLLVLLMGGAALVAGSRAGVVSLAAALLGMVGLAARGRSGARRGMRLAVATALILLAGAWIGGDILYGTLERLAGELGRPGESPRVHVWTDAVDLWRASPAVGTGLGTFGVVYPLFRTLELPVAFTHGESDWVQLLTDTGLAGLALALLTMGAAGTALLARLGQARGPRSRLLALAGFVALLGAAVHGIGNYTLPVMSNLVYLATALVLGLRGGLAVEAARPAPAAEPRAEPWLARPGVVAGGVARDGAVPGDPVVRGAPAPGAAAMAGSPADAAVREEAAGGAAVGSATVAATAGPAAGPLARAAAGAYRAAQAHRALVSMLAYAGVTVGAYAAAYLLRFELTWPRGYAGTFAASLALLVTVRLACARAFRFATGRWRFVGTRDVLRLAGGTSAGTLMFYVATRALPFVPPVPRSVVLIEWVLDVYLTAGLWLAYRLAFEQLRHRRSRSATRARRVIVVGAGEAGNLLVHEMLRVPTGYRPVGFVDDDRAKVGTSLHGVQVLGTTASLGAAVRAHRADELIVAVPSAGPAALRRIVERCEATGLGVKVLPGIAEVLAGDVRLNHLRDVRIEDLLGREPIRLELPQLAGDLRGRVVLVTGAAGSIGRELARQIALHRPGRLVLLDQAETDLFYLELDLRERHPGLDLVPVVGDVVDTGTVERVFRDHVPSRVYHAAAYKHVPMMEVNAREAVRNNVLGTFRVADAAGRRGAEKLVLVSTDKAARPANVMGATKRLAELAVLELQARYPGTAYAAVRFGNVLGSQGSVIPIFRRQIEAGKPLTVTHPEATRYFMTIPEAVQLVLQAALLPEIRGRIAMLEMGEPVRILDLARRLQRLLGGPRGGGRDVTFTGLRPGERLHEELVAPDEETAPTAIPKVRLVTNRNGNGAAGGVGARLPEWERLLREGRDAAVVESLARMFPEMGREAAGGRGEAGRCAPGAARLAGAPQP